MKKKFLGVMLLLLTVALWGISVSAQTPAVYDAATEGIVSDYYSIDYEKGYITGIAPDTPVQTVINTCAPAGLTASGEKLATGTVLSYTPEDAEPLSLTAIVTGDLNGDGAVTISDLLMLKSAVLGKKLEASAACAGDTNYDGKVTVTDFLKVKSVLLGQQTLGIAPGVREKLMLLEPGTVFSWQPEAAAWESDNEAVATVDETGMVSIAAEGTAFLYARDPEGALVARQMVTVLSQPLQVALDQKSCRLTKGQSLTLTAQLNHPVAAAVSWASSDPKIVTVENGKLTACNFGTAKVTATLENGSTAQASVTVAPTLKSISIERTLYKVKPNNTKKLSFTMQPADALDELVWTSSDNSIATVSADGIVTGKKNGTVTITVTGKYSGLKASCKVKVCNVKQVAFTFDDGPSKQTEKLLDFLKENDIRVTFFLVGDRISAYGKTVKRQALEGHEIGYHSYAHDNQKSLSAQQIRADFDKTNDLLKKLTGQSFTLWRAPGGNIDEKVLSSVPLPHIMWSLDSQDWVTRNADSVYSAIRNAKDGSIVLMHDLYSFTVNGAIRAMKEMLAGDYEFVTVTELLSRDGTPPEPGVDYRKG